VAPCRAADSSCVGVGIKTHSSCRGNDGELESSWDVFSIFWRVLRVGATVISLLSYVGNGSGDDDALRFAMTACARQACEVGSEACVSCL
jgi:hypothetical protein